MKGRGVRRGLVLGGGLAGLAIIAFLVAVVGWRRVAGAVAAIGWGGFLAFILCWLGVLVILGVAWAVVAPGGGPIGRFLWGRLLREAAADLLPLSQLGGFVIGSRGVIAAGGQPTLVLASALVDLTTELFAQAFYTLIGLVFLATRLNAVDGGPAALSSALLGLLAVFAAAVGAFLVGKGRSARRLAGFVARWWPESQRRVDEIVEAVTAIYRQPARVAFAVALHVVAWIGSSAVSWIALRLMGVSIELGDVIAVESLMYAVRNVGFALPAGLGVQEAAYVLIGPVFGLPAGEALALSLLKRGRDIIVAAPVIAAWQFLEARSLLRRRKIKGSS